MASLSDPLARQLLDGRYIATLATLNSDGSIHMVAVWYWWDGTHLYLATASATRKARNLKATPTVSVMIDSRDPQASFGVTIAGKARILSGEESKKWNSAVHGKYLSKAALADPRIGPVFAGWDDITLEVTPSSVFAWDMREADRQAFGGAFAGNPGYLLPLER